MLDLPPPPEEVVLLTQIWDERRARP